MTTRSTPGYQRGIAVTSASRSHTASVDAATAMPRSTVMAAPRTFDQVTRSPQLEHRFLVYGKRTAECHPPGRPWLTKAPHRFIAYRFGRPPDHHPDRLPVLAGHPSDSLRSTLRSHSL